MKIKTFLSNQTVDIPENVDITLKECSHFQGNRGTLEGDFSHIKVEFSFLGMKRRGSVSINGGEINRYWLLFSHSVVMFRSKM